MNLKHTVRDFIISAIHYSGVAALYRSRAGNTGPLVRVLCFHDVKDAKWFSSVIEFLSQEYNVIKPEEFEAESFATDRINILITFDDGYRSWIDVVLPILQKHQITGIFFVNSGLLDVANDETAVEHFMRERLLLSPKEPLSWDGARELLAAGHTIGGHTKNHIRLSSVSNDDFKGEVESDRAAIAEQIGLKPTHFAIPYGRPEDYSEEQVEKLKGAGYKYIFNASTHFYRPSDTTIHRTLVENNQSLRSLKQWIGGAYDVFCKLK